MVMQYVPVNFIDWDSDVFLALSLGLFFLPFNCYILAENLYHTRGWRSAVARSKLVIDKLSQVDFLV